MTIYTVKRGDTLYNIARRYGATVDALAYDNQIANVSGLAVGQALIISSDTTAYTVKRGDTLYQISQRFGVTLSALLAANPGISDPAMIYPGQTINIPGAAKKRGIDVNGYTTRFSGRGVIETLPYLTYISPFSYETTAEGELRPINDTAVLALAKSEGVAPLLCLTNTSPGAGFSSDVAHAVMTQQPAQDALIKNLLTLMDAGGYYGLNLDFEYVYPYDRESYNQFLRKLAPILHDKGYILITAVAPKISANQAGTLYEAHDYPVHGEVCDYVVIMTYEWGYTYGPSMAVSPVGPVRQVLNYAVTAIPPEKILMGMPNYGYDWTLPFVQGSAAKGITNAGAVEQAVRVNAEIKYDAVQKAPYYNYYDDAGKRHEIWFDDARSVSARLALVEEYGLAGISWWEIDSVFRQGQLVLTDMYSVDKV
jgi:spore germination protein